MSDNFAPAPGPEAFGRMREAVDAEIAGYSAEDPNSVCFGKPEMAARLRTDAENRLREIMTAHGLTAPAPKTEDEIREAQLETRWQAKLGDRQRELIDQEITRLEGLDHAARAHQIAELRASLGDDYDRLVADARAGYPGGTLPEAALASKFALQNLQALHRYRSAHGRARAAAGFTSK